MGNSGCVPMVRGSWLIGEFCKWKKNILMSANDVCFGFQVIGGERSAIPFWMLEDDFRSLTTLSKSSKLTKTHCHLQ